MLTCSSDEIQSLARWTLIGCHVSLLFFADVEVAILEKAVNVYFNADMHTGAVTRCKLTKSRSHEVDGPVT